jgi:crossover junction endodeoxyribonuclease RuvC
LIDTHNPDEIIEAPFFGKNVQSLKLGRAQGVAIAAGLLRYSHYRVRTQENKMAITGNGNASKEQVAKMLQQLLGLKELPKTSINGWFGCGLSLF